MGTSAPLRMQLGNGVFSELVKIDGGFIFGTLDLILDVVIFHTPLDDIAYDFFLHFIFGFSSFSSW